MTRLTDLEEALVSDAQGARLQQLLEMILIAKKQLQQQRLLPAVPTLYQANTLQIEACVATEKVIRILWSRYHPTITR